MADRRRSEAYQPRVGWRKDVADPFYASGAYIVGLLALILLCGVIIFASAFSGHSGLSAVQIAFILVMPLGCMSIFCAVWHVAQRVGFNSALSNGRAVEIHTRKFRNLYFYSYAVFASIAVGYFFGIWFRGSKEPGISSFVDWWYSPFVISIAFVVFLVLAPLAVSSMPEWAGYIEIGPEGVKYFVGRNTPVDIRWDEINSLSVSYESYRCNLTFDLRDVPALRRNFMLIPCAGVTEINIKGRDVEPNAIIRIIRECMEYPESRELLGTPLGVQAVTYGPRWREVCRAKAAAAD